MLKIVAGYYVLQPDNLLFLLTKVCIEYYSYLQLILTLLHCGFWYGVPSLGLYIHC